MVYPAGRTKRTGFCASLSLILLIAHLLFLPVINPSPYKVIFLDIIIKQKPFIMRFIIGGFIIFLLLIS